MKCPACGADNREGAHFCRYCGAALAELATPETPEESGSPEATPVAKPVEPDTTEAAEPEVGSDRVVDQEPLLGAKGSEALSEKPSTTAKGAEDTGEPGVEGKEVEESALPEEGVSEVRVTEEPLEAALLASEGSEASEGAEERPGLEGADTESLESPEQPGEGEAASAPVEGIGGEDQTEGPQGADRPAPAVGPVTLEKEGQGAPTESDDGLFGFWREEGEPLEPVPPETTIAERYTVVKVLDAKSNEVRYLAHDQGSCWQCGFEGNELADEFCSQCGVALDRPAEVHLVEVEAGRTVPSSGEPVVAQLTQLGRHFLVLGEPHLQPEMAGTLAPPSIRLLVGQRSDQGQVRDLDEDSLFALTMSPTYESRMGPVLGVFAVADGMGGYEGGEVASRLAIQTLVDEVLRTIILPELAGEMMLEEDFLVRLRQATVAANDDVYLTRKKGGNDMGTTLTVALVRDDRLFLSHVGDCRAYRWNADGLERLTTDHSVVASMIAEGRAEPEDIYTHPHRSVVYRCIGDKPVVEVDTDVLPLAPSDRLVLCCDGLWEMVRDEGIEDVMMQESDPQQACDLLVQRANAAGGDDNISVIVVQVEEV